MFLIYIFLKPVNYFYQVFFKIIISLIFTTGKINSNFILFGKISTFILT